MKCYRFYRSFKLELTKIYIRFKTIFSIIFSTDMHILWTSLNWFDVETHGKLQKSKSYLKKKQPSWFCTKDVLRNCYLYTFKFNEIRFPDFRVIEKTVIDVRTITFVRFGYQIPKICIHSLFFPGSEPK